ncbi:MAG TPA: hypothetical protein VJ972_16495 [Anaerolineales bacterium]|nr:hypothetical protein [Anaerolineales bacterium]
MTTNTLIIALATLIILVVGGVLAFTFYARQRTKRLKDDFGSEYDSAMEEMGSRNKAENVLADRKARVKSLNIRTLDLEEQNHFLMKWRMIQSDFINDPDGNVEDADRLVTEVMLARGYPMAPLEQRMENLSVNHTDVISDYREAADIAAKSGKDDDVDTESLRQAMLHYKSVFDEILAMNPDQEVEPEYEMASER